MSPNFLASQPQNDIALPMKKLVTNGTKVPTTPEGGNHGHTNTITPQPSKTLHTAESRAEYSRKISNTLKPRVETTITPQPIKIPSNTAEPRVENLRTKGGNHQEPRAKIRKPRAEIQKPRAKSQKPRTKSQEPRSKIQEPRAKSRDPKAKSRDPKAKSTEPRAKSQEPSAEGSKEADSQEGSHSHEGALLPRRSPTPKKEPYSKEGGREHVNVNQATGVVTTTPTKKVGALNGTTTPRKKVVDEQGAQEDGVRGRCPFFPAAVPVVKASA
jgi:hypothetical protein